VNTASSRSRARATKPAGAGLPTRSSGARVVATTIPLRSTTVPTAPTAMWAAASTDAKLSGVMTATRTPRIRPSRSKGSVTAITQRRAVGSMTRFETCGSPVWSVRWNVSSPATLGSGLPSGRRRFSICRPEASTRATDSHRR
jgi:hypothetical protein